MVIVLDESLQMQPRTLDIFPSFQFYIKNNQLPFSITWEQTHCKFILELLGTLVRFLGIFFSVNCALVLIQSWSQKALFLVYCGVSHNSVCQFTFDFPKNAQWLYVETFIYEFSTTYPGMGHVGLEAALGFSIRHEAGCMLGLNLHPSCRKATAPF